MTVCNQPGCSTYNATLAAVTIFNWCGASSIREQLEIAFSVSLDLGRFPEAMPAYQN